MECGRDTRELAGFPWMAAKVSYRDQEEDKAVHFHHLFNTVMEILAKAIRQEKEMKDIQIRKEDIKLSLFADYMRVYIENTLGSTRKLLNLSSEVIKIVSYKANSQKIKAFFIPAMKYQKQKLGKNPIHYSNKKNKVPRNTLNQGGKSTVLRKPWNTEERNSEIYK